MQREIFDFVTAEESMPRVRHGRMKQCITELICLGLSTPSQCLQLGLES